MKHLFFDLDGTLVDSSEGIINCFTLTFQAVNIPVPDLDTLKTFIGPPLESTFAKYGNQDIIGKLMSTYRQFYHDKGVNQVKLYEGIVPALKRLKENGYNLYVATSKNHEMAIKMLTDLSIIDLFEGVYGAIENSFHKTDIIRRALSERQIDTRQAMMTGDTYFDMVGGKTVEMTCLGVLWGFGSEQSLIEHGADYLVKEPSQIPELIFSL